MNIFKENSGQVLVETMVALTMVTIGLLGILSLLSYSIGLNKVVSDQYVASYIAAEGIEIVKNIIDNNVVSGNPYNTGLDSPGNYIADYKSTSLTPVDSTNNVPLRFDNCSSLGATMKYAYIQDCICVNTAAQTSFKRTINISYYDINEMIVKSTVDWTSRGGITGEIVVEDHFYNWR